MANLGLRLLPPLDAENRKRQDMVMTLLGYLREIHDLALPQIPQGAQPIFLSFVARCRKSGALAKELLRRGVDTSPGYLKNCAAFPRYGGERGRFPRADEFEKEQIHLPVHGVLKAKDAAHIARAVEDALRNI